MYYVNGSLRNRNLYGGNHCKSECLETLQIVKYKQSEPVSIFYIGDKHAQIYKVQWEDILRNIAYHDLMKTVKERQTELIEYLPYPR